MIRNLKQSKALTMEKWGFGKWDVKFTNQLMDGLTGEINCNPQNTLYTVDLIYSETPAVSLEIGRVRLDDSTNSEHDTGIKNFLYSDIMKQGIDKYISIVGIDAESYEKALSDFESGGGYSKITSRITQKLNYVLI